MYFAAGTQLGSYEIVESVGRGGMATVYRAYHAPLDRHVAIKVIHMILAQDEGQLRRFRREARAVARLEHPNIVPIYDYAEKGLQPYLVMRYVAGETLKERMSRGPLAVNEITRIMSQVAAGLDYAHQQGILHRDIKPSNIILAESGEVYLTDFGLARLFESGESTISHNRMMGTPFYMSPEQARGDLDLNPQADIYSFGIVLYELVTGRVPFNADTSFSVVHDHIFSQPPRPSDLNPTIPTSVETVILKALQKESQLRYDTSSCLMVDFAAAADSATGEIIVPAFQQAASPTEADGTLKDDEPPPLPILLEPPAVPIHQLTPQPVSRTPPRNRRYVWWVTGLILFCLLGIGFLAILDWSSNQGAVIDGTAAATGEVATIQATSADQIRPGTVLNVNFELLGERSRPLAAIQRDLAEYPDSRFLNFEFAIALIANDQFDDAAESLAPTLDVITRPEAYLLIANELLAIERPVTATLVLALGFERFQDDEIQHLLISLLVMLNSDPADLQQLLDFIAAEEPSSTNELDLLLGEAHIFVSQGRGAAAIGLLDSQEIIDEAEIIGELAAFKTIFLARSEQKELAETSYLQARMAGYPDWMQLFLDMALGST